MDERDVAGAGSESPVVSGAARSDRGRLVVCSIAHGGVRRAGAFGNGIRTASVRLDVPGRNRERSCRISGIIVYEVADARRILLAERGTSCVDVFSMVPTSDEFAAEVQSRTSAEAGRYGASGGFGPTGRA